MGGAPLDACHHTWHGQCTTSLTCMFRYQAITITQTIGILMGTMSLVSHSGCFNLNENLVHSGLRPLAASFLEDLMLTMYEFKFATTRVQNILKTQSCRDNLLRFSLCMRCVEELWNPLYVEHTVRRTVKSTCILNGCSLASLNDNHLDMTVGHVSKHWQSGLKRQKRAVQQSLKINISPHSDSKLVA